MIDNFSKKNPFNVNRMKKKLIQSSSDAANFLDELFIPLYQNTRFNDIIKPWF